MAIYQSDRMRNNMCGEERSVDLWKIIPQLYSRKSDIDTPAFHMPHRFKAAVRHVFYVDCTMSQIEGI